MHLFSIKQLESPPVSKVQACLTITFPLAFLLHMLLKGAGVGPRRSTYIVIWDSRRRLTIFFLIPWQI